MNLWSILDYVSGIYYKTPLIGLLGNELELLGHTPQYFIPEDLC